MTTVLEATTPGREYTIAERIELRQMAIQSLLLQLASDVMELRETNAEVLATCKAAIERIDAMVATMDTSG